MKHGGHKKRSAQAAEEISEEEMLLITSQIARGITTPAVAGAAGGQTPRLGAAAPATPFEERRAENNRRAREQAAEFDDEQADEKRRRRVELPPEGTIIQGSQHPREENEDMTVQGEKRSAEEPASPPTSPKRDRIYAPGFAGDIRMVEIEHTGEEEEEWLNYERCRHEKRQKLKSSRMRDGKATMMTISQRSMRQLWHGSTTSPRTRRSRG